MYNIVVYHEPNLTTSVETITNVTVDSNATTYNETNVLDYYTNATTTQNTTQTTTQEGYTQPAYVVLHYFPSGGISSTNGEKYHFYLRPRTTEHYYPPVKSFIVSSMFGNPESDVAVNIDRQILWTDDDGAIYDSDSLPQYRELNTNFTTGIDGSVSYVMYPATNYSMSFYKEDVINREMILQPRQDTYRVVTDFNLRWWNEDWDYNIHNETNITINTTEANATHGNITFRYIDNLSETLNLTVYLNTTDTTDWRNQTNLDVFRINATSDVTHIFNITNYAGVSYYLRFVINHTTFGERTRDFSVRFPGMLITLGLPANVYPFLAFGLIIFFGSFFGSKNAEQGALISCFIGWIMWAVDWLAILGAIAVVALSFATIISIISIIMKKGQMEGHV